MKVNQYKKVVIVVNHYTIALIMMYVLIVISHAKLVNFIVPNAPHVKME